MYLPAESNSRRLVVALPYSGPDVAVPGWLSTTTVPFEFTATASISPKFIPGGSFRGSGTDSNWSMGALLLSTAGRCCAPTGAAAAAMATNKVEIRPTDTSWTGVLCNNPFLREPDKRGNTRKGRQHEDQENLCITPGVRPHCVFRHHLRPHVRTGWCRAGD